MREASGACMCKNQHFAWTQRFYNGGCWATRTSWRQPELAVRQCESSFR
jgi:hypothetical protein